MQRHHAYEMLATIRGETTRTIVGSDRPRIDAARVALGLEPLSDGQDVAAGLGPCPCCKGEWAVPVPVTDAPLGVADHDTGWISCPTCDGGKW